MAKTSGGTRTGSSRPLSATTMAGSRRVSMPKKYGEVNVTENGYNYAVSHVPTGYGNQQKNNGRLTVRDTKSGDYWDFSYGYDYSGRTTAKDAWKNAQRFMRNRQKKTY